MAYMIKKLAAVINFFNWFFSTVRNYCRKISLRVGQ